MTEVETMAENIDFATIVQNSLLARYGINKATEDINGHLERLIGTYGIEPRTAVLAVTRMYAEHEGFEFMPTVLDVRYMPLDTWASFEAKITKQVDIKNDKIAFAGSIGDEYGTIDILVWSGSTVPELKPGMVCKFENVVTDKYKDYRKVIVNAKSTITLLNKDIQVREFRKTTAN